MKRTSIQSENITKTKQTSRPKPESLFELPLFAESTKTCAPSPHVRFGESE